MKRIFIIFTILILVLSASFSVHAMGSPQSTNPNGYNYVPPAQPPQVKSSALPPQKLPPMFYVPNISANRFNIGKIPEDILDFGPLISFEQSIFIVLVIFGFVYNMYMNLYRFATGGESQNRTYWQIFGGVFWAFVAFIIWKNGIFFTQYLNAIDNIQSYILTNLTLQSVTHGIVQDVRNMINTVHPKGSGFEWYNPFTWAKLGLLAGKVIQEFMLSNILFLIFVLYTIIFFIVYLFQLLILGFLFGVFPIAVALNVGEYASKHNILTSWFKWFFEVSTWGFAILLENVLFNVVVGDYLANSGFLNTATGMSFLVAIGLMVVMIVMLLTGPFLIHKIFGFTAAHGHVQASNQKVREIGQKAGQVAKAVATGGASIPADMAKETGKQAAGQAAGTSSQKLLGNDTIIPPYGPVAGGVAPGVSQLGYTPRPQIEYKPQS